MKSPVNKSKKLVKTYFKLFPKADVSESFFSEDLITILEYSRCSSANSQFQILKKFLKLPDKIIMSHFIINPLITPSMNAALQYFR
jgi:hypothetical protein